MVSILGVGFLELATTVGVCDLWRFSKHFIVGSHKIYI